MKVITYDANRLMDDLNNFMESNHITNAWLARKTNVDAAVISKFRNGVYCPPERTVEKLVIEMGKTIHDYRVESIGVSIQGVYIDQMKRLPFDILENVVNELNSYMEIRRKNEVRIRELENNIKVMKIEIQHLKDGKEEA